MVTPGQSCNDGGICHVNPPGIVNGYFPRIRRCMGTENPCIFDRHHLRIRRRGGYCFCGSMIPALSTVTSCVYAGTWGPKIPALSTATTRVYAGVVGVECGDHRSPHCRRLLLSFLFSCCLWHTFLLLPLVYVDYTAVTAAGKVTRLSSSVCLANARHPSAQTVTHGASALTAVFVMLTLPALSTATSRVYAGIWRARIPALSTAITRVYAGIADALYAGIDGEKRTDCVCWVPLVTCNKT